MPSDTETSAQQRRELPDSDVRAQLDRILASEVFSRSQHLRRFLSFIVDNDWPGRANRSRNRSSPTSCTGRARTSTAVPIPWFGWMPGDFATSCASTTRAAPIPSSSRCRRAAMCPSSKRSPVSSIDAAPSIAPPEPQPQVPPAPQQAPPVSNVRRATIAVSWLGGRRRRHPRRARLAHTHAGERSSPAAPAGFEPRCGGPAGVVSGRQPGRVRLVGPRRSRADGHLCEGRRERGLAAAHGHAVFRDQPVLVP